MPNRVYLLIALAFIIGSPLVVSVISDALPPARTTEAETMTTMESPPAPILREQQPETMVETTVPSGSAEPIFDAAPTMDPQGYAIPGTPEASLTEMTPPPPPPPLPQSPAPNAEDTRPLDPSTLPPDIPASQHH